MIIRASEESVSVPYEITLLSNSLFLGVVGSIVSVPYEITLLSNPALDAIVSTLFQYLMKLHYSQTAGQRTLQA